MLRASALLYSVVFSIVILIITLFIVASIYDSQISVIKLRRIEHANDNMESAVAVLLNTDNNSSVLDLFKDGKDIAYINSYKWGLFDVKDIVCAIGKDTLRKAFILGYTPDKNYAVNITSTDRILNIAGRTLIKGNAYVPNGTFKRAYIEGRGSLSASPISGQIKQPPYTSSLDMGKLKLDIGSFLADNDANENISANEFKPVSFSGKPAQLYSNGVIHINGEAIKGHYLIRSATKIIVGSNAVLEDIILVAPEIELQDGFAGTLQCIASNKLVIGKRVDLKYPSALCVMPTVAADSSCLLEFGEDSKMAGTIVAFTGREQYQKTLLSMHRNSVLHGQIFSEGLTQLQGTVIGNISTGNFYLETASSIYDNTLLDAEISILDINSNYFSYINGKGAEKGIVKWLY